MYENPDKKIKKEKTRRKREIITILFLIPLIAFLLFIGTRILDFGADFPFSYTLFMFGLVNINLLLLLLLLVLIFRNIIKFYYEKESKTPSKLRTRLLIAFIALTLLPSSVLFIFSMNFISSSIEYWFNPPIEQALEKAIEVGRYTYNQADKKNLFHIENIMEELKEKKLDNKEELNDFLKKKAEILALDLIELYDSKGEITASYIKPSLAEDIYSLSPSFINQIAPDSTKSITDTILSGEMVRSIKNTSQNQNQPDYIVAGQSIPRELIKNLDIINQGASEYKQIKLLKQPVQRIYLLALSLVAALTFFAAVWFSFKLAKTITTPIMKLAEATERIKQGDLKFQVDLKSSANDEIGILINSFNLMTKELHMGREQLSFSRDMLQEQNRENEERRHYIETILKNVSAGVISFNTSGTITTINPSAERMLDISAKKVLRRNYRTIIPDNHRDLVKKFEEKIENIEDSLEIPMNLNIAGQARSFISHFSSLKNKAGKRIGTVMLFDDVTELEKAQRMAAWREVARRIAHEVKNPITPLSLSAQRLRRKYSSMLKDPVFDECTKIIINQVELIRNLVNAFADYARFPSANLRREKLEPILTSTLSSFKSMYPEIEFQTKIEEDLPKIQLDPQQSQQLIFNLLENAVTALKQKGRIDLRLFRKNRRLRLEIKDYGPGIKPEEKIRLFEPYYTTKSNGTGLGLSIVNSIVTEHKASISIYDNQPSGSSFCIDFPIPGEKEEDL